MDKLSCISCDLEAKDLGINEKGFNILKNEVEIFYHCAATLKFNEKLR